MIEDQPKIRHFKEQFLNRGKRITLKKNLQPYPTIHTEKALKRSSTLQVVAVPRKAPKIRVFQKDELEDFKSGCSAFALLHYYDDFVMRQDYLNVRKACTYILHHCSPHQLLSCEKHNADALKFAIKMVVNIYCNNKQKIKNDSVVKDTITGFKKPQRSKQT